jgi:hypothetical protein
MIAYNHDAHVRDYYDQPVLDSSKFAGQRRAVLAAYEMSLNGFVHDDFGDVDTWGYHARVLFNDCPFIVCFREDSQGFVDELESSEYEAVWAEYVEQSENEDESEDEDEFA